MAQISLGKYHIAFSSKFPGKAKIPMPYGTGITSVPRLDSAGNFTGTQTPGTNVHMAGGTLDDSLHALNVGLPSTIGTSVGVGNSDTKGHTLVAKLTLSHPLHLLAVLKSCGAKAP